MVDVELDIVMVWAASQTYMRLDVVDNPLADMVKNMLNAYAILRRVRAQYGVEDK